MNPSLPDIILGSTSPRRKEILSFFQIPFIQASPDFDEDSVPQHLDPDAYAVEIAKGKLLSLIPKHQDSLIITADTVVYKEGLYFGKPKNEEEAAFFLNSLQGSWHSVISAVCLYYKGQIVTQAEETRVHFNFLTNEEILKYISFVKWQDKAGGYSIQDSGGLLVNRIEGCFYNVLGFPINTFRYLLKEVGIDLWQFL